MKQKKLDMARVLADPTARMLADYVQALADLAQPKACIPLLHDHSRLDAYHMAIDAALHELPGVSYVILPHMHLHYQVYDVCVLNSTWSDILPFSHPPSQKETTTKHHPMCLS